MRYLLVVAILVLGSVAQQPAGSTSADKNQTSTSAEKTARDKGPPKRVVANLSGFELDPKKSKPQGVQIGAGSRGAAVPPALYAPKLGRAYGLRPVFFWGDSPGAQKFTFRLYDSNDDEIYEQEVAGNIRSFSYPQYAPQLAAGSTYSWTVQTIAAQLVEPPEPARIMLVSGADRQSIEQALQSSKGDALADRWKRAQVLVEHRLWYDAVGAYSQLISENRENADLYQERAQIYAQLPETQVLANQDMEQASKLQSTGR
jgi:Domain of Unknown Function (DUF928)